MCCFEIISTRHVWKYRSRTLNVGNHMEGGTWSVAGTGWFIPLGVNFQQPLYKRLDEYWNLNWPYGEENDLPGLGNELRFFGSPADGLVTIPTESSQFSYPVCTKQYCEMQYGFQSLVTLLPFYQPMKLGQRAAFIWGDRANNLLH
jgi:hypothetical protein